MIARVAFPIALSGIFDYAVPQHFESFITPGVPVKVELRSRVLWGVVVEIAQESAFKSLKNVLEVKQQQWTESGKAIVKLYSWIASYYQTEFGKVFKPLIRKRLVDLQPRTVAVYRVDKAAITNLTARQSEVVEKIKDISNEVSKSFLVESCGLSQHMLEVLCNKKILIKDKKQILREGPELAQEVEDNEVTLSIEQQQAVEMIWNNGQNEQKPVLLFGITGSGKTHVYIELAKRTLRDGKGVIILVPEISLTAQTIQRFRDAIGSDIAVIHSRMSDGERRDSIDEIVSGRRRIVIGVRSAILAPLNNTGLILVDEEHDGSYKQSEPEPRYQARDVAVMRGQFQNALVVLGSATPSFESYYNACTGKYMLVKLMQRFGDASLPQVKIIDMNQEHREGNWTFLARYLHNRISSTVEEGRQVILLINRRGFSVSLICTSCGHIYTCPNCSVNCIYHSHEMILKCHQCNHTEPAPVTCVECGGEQIKYQGTGIQKVEEFLKCEFPHIRLLRMDQDTTRRKGAHVSILSAFAKREADILLGTQMVAKGLNFPGVKLVGVLQADIGLHFPDFRAAERTFQLLTQVAGRAGRKDSLGEVVIQTYSPHEPGIIAAQTHDFEGFYDREIGSREDLGYPPFNRLARIILQGPAEVPLQTMLNSIGRYIVQSGKGADFEVLGPAPALLSKLKQMYRYSMLIKSSSPKHLQVVLNQIRRQFQKLPDKMRLVIDIDPINML